MPEKPNNKRSKLTQAELKKIVHYDPNTGIFTRIKRTANCIRVGDIAGSPRSGGYLSFYVHNKQYLAHRLAWLYMEGYFPKNIDIDHIDRIRHHNWWDNLRLASSQCNSRNRTIAKNNTSGVTGVYWTEQHKIWRARIVINDKDISLGSFKRKQNAVLARWEAEVKYNFPECNTTSTAYHYLKERQENRG